MAPLDGDTAVERVAISGAALAALMHAVNSSAGDCDGVLFGHVERSTTSRMVDEDVGSRTSHDSAAVVTGHFCSGRVASFYDATGRIDGAKLAQMVGEREGRGGDAPVGWFVGRRGTTMRPSMREFTVTAHLRDVAVGSEDGRDGGAAKDSCNGVVGDGNDLSSKEWKRIGVPSSSPCIFFLLTESSDANSIHTHEYRAYQYMTKASGAGCFEPRCVNIVNIGPAFRGQYDSFAPVAPFPWLLKSSALGGPGSDEGFRRLTMGSDTDADVQMDGREGSDQALLDMYSEDFSVDRLQSLVRTEGEGGSVRELEALYRTMLRKLDVLAKQVCEGNEVIFEQVRSREALFLNRDL